MLNQLGFTEYDEKIAANEPDMTYELKEVDLEVCERSR